MGGGTGATTKQTPKTDAQKTAQTTYKTHTLEEKDTDGDGLKDWQEDLYGTDKTKKDTDGDGIPDAVEIRTSQAPTTTDALSLSTSTTTPEQKTLTRALTRQIFAAYVQAKQEKTFNQKEFNTFVENLTKQAYDKSILPKFTYSVDDIKHIIKPTEKNVRFYKKAFDEAVKEFDTIDAYEMTLYAQAVKTQNPDDFAKLRSVADIYRRVAKNLMIMPVPSDYTRQHVRLANNFVTFASVLDKLAFSETDPMLSFVAIREFLDTEANIKTAYTDMDAYFELQHNVQ